VAVHLLDGIEWVSKSLNPLKHLGYSIRGLRAARKLAELAEKIKADTICINGLNALFLPRAGFLGHLPVGIVMHGTRLTGAGLLDRLFFAIQGRWVARYLSASETGRRLLTKAGVDGAKIDVISNGVDCQLYRPAPPDAALAAALGIAGGGPIVGAVTHLSPRKAAHHLVAAMAIVAAKIPGARCVIVGDVTAADEKPYARRVADDIRRLGLEDRVILAGRRADIPSVMNLFDVVAHPSETEACPCSVIEAQACGKAVVGFQTGGMGEIVQDGQTGILVEPFDEEALAGAIVDLLSDTSRRQSMGENARRRMEGLFNLETNIAKVVSWLINLP
jgi:glycosyltransferase involved in cell wall biosynthesis